MKKLERLDRFKETKLGKDELAKFHGGAENWDFCVIEYSPKRFKIVRDGIGERAVAR